jgi:hypothetical protein
MAQTMKIELVDDLDGGEAEETVTFGLDGVEYEIDLSAANAERLRQQLAEFVEVSRRTGGRLKRGAAAAKNGQAESGPKASAVREWLRNQGHEISERGRIPNELVRKFEEAMAEEAAKPATKTKATRTKPATKTKAGGTAKPAGAGRAKPATNGRRRAAPAVTAPAFEDAAG